MYGSWQIGNTNAQDYVILSDATRVVEDGDGILWAIEPVIPRAGSPAIDRVNAYSK